MKGLMMMGVTQYADGSMFVPIRSGQICPVCGSKRGRCAEFYNAEGIKVFYRCKYRPSHRPSGDGWYIHLVSEVDGYDPMKERLPRILPEVKQEEITFELLELRDKVYRRFRELVKKYEGSYLYERDEKDLLRRGLTKEQIERMMFFSVPTSGNKVWADGDYMVKVTTAISKELENEFGSDLLKVPGFIKRTNKKTGDEYVTFKTVRKDLQEKFVPIKGYFIPYVNIFGQIVGLQYRLTEPMYDEKGKLLRYFWYSCENARSGAPCDYYIPSELKRDDVLLVTEGAIKGKIAAEKLGFEGMFEAGVHNYRRLVKNIIALEKIQGKKYNIILALDIEDNPDVRKAEKNTIAMLKGTGHQVAIAYWDPKDKGIDDALQAGQKIKYKIV
ncbi:MAG: DUF3854 domain-containing protein [Thermosipho sp. (in: Bacteria)]|nr:DUF3854 domain-containing protein [Thermosipho sp. (in: thermotogales)]